MREREREKKESHNIKKREVDIYFFCEKQTKWDGEKEIIKNISRVDEKMK